MPSWRTNSLRFRITESSFSTCETNSTSTACWQILAPTNAKTAIHGRYHYRSHLAHNRSDNRRQSSAAEGRHAEVYWLIQCQAESLPNNGKNIARTGGRVSEVPSLEDNESRACHRLEPLPVSTALAQTTCRWGWRDLRHQHQPCAEFKVRNSCTVIMGWLITQWRNIKITWGGEPENARHETYSPESTVHFYFYLFIYKWQRATSATNMSYSIQTLKSRSNSINTKARKNS